MPIPSTHSKNGKVIFHHISIEVSLFNISEIMGFGLAKARSRQAEAISLYPYTQFLTNSNIQCLNSYIQCPKSKLQCLISWQLNFLTILPLLELDSEAAPSCSRLRFEEIKMFSNNDERWELGSFHATPDFLYTASMDEAAMRVTSHKLQSIQRPEV